MCCATMVPFQERPTSIAERAREAGEVSGSPDTIGAAKRYDWPRADKLEHLNKVVAALAYRMASNLILRPVGHSAVEAEAEADYT